MTNKLVTAIKSALGLPTNMIIGTVAAVEANGTLDVNIRGTIVTGLSCLSSYIAPQVGDNVEILAYGSTQLVIGTAGVSSGVYIPAIQSSVVPITFTTQTSAVINVTYPIAFNTVPNVFTNIASGSGTTTSWASRAISVGTTGFQIFVFGPSNSWSSIPVQWMAVRT